MHLNDSTRRWLPRLLLAIAIIVTAMVYWPGVFGGWVFDDYPNIVQNNAIHIQPGHQTLAAWVNAALSSPASFLHRPLASITFAINWMMGSGDPEPFKITNIIIHLVNGVLVFCMLRALLRLIALRWPDRIEAPAATRLALVVSAAWLLLPINLMAVLYVVQRMESLCQVFVLAGLWAYLHGRWMMLTAADARRDQHGFSLAVGGVVLGTLIGLTSKETAVLLPVFAFLAEAIVIRFGRVSGDILPHLSRAILPADDVESSLNGAITSLPLSEQREIDGNGSLQKTKYDKRIWALFILTLCIPAALGFLWLLRIALRPATWAGRDFTLGQRLLTESRVLVDYLHWTLFPNPDVLSLYHDEIVKSTGLLSPWTTLGAILLLAALVVIAVWLRNRRPLVSLGVCWFFASQLLTATIVPLELVYEQRMYFGSIGVLLAAGALLLGLRWKVVARLVPGRVSGIELARFSLAVTRILVVGLALLWFALATNSRAQEWSNPLRLAIAEAKRHPESARAVYEAGRLLLIASNYQPGKALDESRKYLHKAANIPGSSSLPDQALIMIADHHRQGADADYWRSMIHKLRSQPTRQEDISALISLTNCYETKICEFDASWLQRAYAAALSRPAPIARLLGAYADFQRDIVHNDMQAEKYLALAVAGDPSEPAYRMDLAALYARNGQASEALQQIDALRRMNLAGRLNGQITTLERLVEQGKTMHRLH